MANAEELPTMKRYLKFVLEPTPFTYNQLDMAKRIPIFKIADWSIQIDCIGIKNFFKDLF